jgi:hypothetical protein
MRKLREQDPVASEPLRQKLEAAAQQIQSRLKQFRKDEWPHIDSDNGQGLKGNQDDIADQMPLHRTARSQNAFSAYLKTMYDAGNIIVLSQLAAASLTPQEHQLKMISHGDSIISSVAYHDSQDTLTSISFSIIFPIKIVCLLSPSNLQRVMAQNVLLKLGTKRGLVELCVAAAPTYMDRSHG